MGRRSATALVALLSAALLAAGCGGKSDTGTGGSGGGGPAPTASVAGTKVTATEKEYSIGLSTMTYKPGVYTFEAQNAGTMPHDLTIAGPGVTQQSTPTLQPGDTAPLTVTLQSGTYELWCSIPGHKQLGMDVKIQVS
ncbi:MAG: hypothetical protein HOV83_36575 [Catenulispora sp.]|nr:hypothetical protein [Catenulispora sp.]